MRSAGVERGPLAAMRRHRTFVAGAVRTNVRRVRSRRATLAHDAARYLIVSFANIGSQGGCGELFTVGSRRRTFGS